MSTVSIASWRPHRFAPWHLSRFADACARFRCREWSSGVAECGGVRTQRHFWRSTIPCRPASRRSRIASPVNFWGCPECALSLPRSLGLVWSGGVAAKTCAAIGRSERRVIIAPGLARIANRTDTSPVRLARASPGIDSDVAPRFPASRNPMAAQVLPPVEARHRNRVEKASSIGTVRLPSGGFFAETHRVPSRARLLWPAGLCRPAWSRL